jgi:hypothetical protein
VSAGNASYTETGAGAGAKVHVSSERLSGIAVFDTLEALPEGWRDNDLFRHELGHFQCAPSTGLRYPSAYGGRDEEAL